MNDTPETVPTIPALIDGFLASDGGNAERLVAAIGTTIRYVEKWQSWIVFRDGRWYLDRSEARIRNAARVVSRNLFDKLSSCIDPKDREAVFKWAKRCDSAVAIRSMIDLARGLACVIISYEDLDDDPWILNCVNGTLDLKTGALRDHDPDDLCTMQAPVQFDPDAECPRFLEVLERALPDPEIRAFLQRWAGSAITGIPEQSLVLAVGSGANSKSVLLEVLQRVLGYEYAVQPHKSLMVSGRFEQHPTHLASLNGARMLVAPETEAGDQLNEELVKSLTGGDRLRARRMREDEWSFEPSWSAALHTNHEPKIRGTDEAIWRRLRLVPFDVTIPADERDPSLTATLTATEMPGILNWMLAGCLAWQEHGNALESPEGVLAPTRAYREEQDHIGRFLAARCVVDGRCQVKTKDLRPEYLLWCADQGEHAWSAIAVSKDLKRRGFESRKTGYKHDTVYSGVGLLCDYETDGSPNADELPDPA